MNPLRRLFSESGISASRARTRTQDARRRARLRPWGEALETRRVLSTFKVNTLLDTDAVNLHSGKDASGRISLRSAIMAADSVGGANTIKLPAGTFKLTIPGANEDAGATGDLDIKGNLTILGKGSNSSIVDGNWCHQRPTELPGPDADDRQLVLYRREAGSYGSTVGSVLWSAGKRRAAGA